MSFADLIEARPRGQMWSYGIKITGIPYFMHNGIGAWAEDGYVEKAGALATRDWTFSREINPIEPLHTGDGVTLALIDDGSNWLFPLFAPAAGDITQLTAELSPSASIAYVLDSSIASSGDDLFCGLETFTAGTPGSGYFNITNRGKYGSLPRTHLLTSDVVGAEVSTSPRVFKGRFVEILIAPVNADYSIDVGNKAVVWAGMLSEVIDADTHIELKIDPLSKAIEQGWPSLNASGEVITSGVYSVDILVEPDDFYLSMRSLDPSTLLEEEFTDYALRGIDPTTGSTSLLTPVSGTYNLLDWLNAIRATVDYATGASGENWTTPVTFSDFSLSLTYEDSKFRVRLVNNSSVKIKLLPAPPGHRNAFSPLYLAALSLASYVDPGDDRLLLSLPASQGVPITLDAEASSVYVRLDDPFRAFRTDAYNVSGSNYVGYAILSGGSKSELVEILGTELTENGVARLRIARDLRYGGIGYVAGGIDWSDEENVTLKQVMFIDGPGSAPEAINISLLSMSGGGSNTSYDKLKYGQGVGIPARYVDYDGIAAATSGIPDINAFWVPDSGKGKEHIENLLKFCGLMLATRRFTRDGESLFGLTVVPIDMPTLTSYDREIDDSHRLEKTRAVSDFNERVIVNAIKFRSFWDPGKSEPTGAEVNVYHDSSISAYGQQRAVEASPAIAIGGTPGTDTQRNTARSQDLQKAQTMAYRWFGAYAAGNYTLSLQSPHSAWVFEPGTYAKATLTGVRDSDGTTGINDKVFQVQKVTETHGGTMPKAAVVLRGAYDDVVEKAPCAHVTANGGTLVTLDANYFSDATQRRPYGGTGDCTDADWFDPAVTGGSLAVWFWQSGDLSGGELKTVSARSGNYLTIDSGLSWNPATYTTFMTYLTWDLVSDWQQRFAYVCDNNGFLGASNDKARKWV